MKKVSIRIRITLLMIAFALGATLLTGVIIYEQMEKQLLQDAWRQQATQLDTACTAVNRRIEQIRSLSWQLSNNSDARTLQHTRQLSAQDILTTRNVIETLQTMKAFDGTIKDVGLYLSGVNRVITAESSYDAETYYARIRGVDRTDIARQRSAQESGLLASFAGVIQIERIIETEEALVFVSAFPIGRTGGGDYVFFHLSMEEMSGLTGGAESGLFLTDAEGRALGKDADGELAAVCAVFFAGADKPSSVTYNRHEYGLLVKETDAEGLYCASVAPYEALKNDAHRIGKTVVLMMSAFMLVSILLAILAGRRFYAPLGQLMHSLEKLGHGFGEKGNEYKLLGDALRYYSDTNHTLSLSWQEASRLLKNQVLQELMEGRLKPAQTEALRQAGIELVYPQVQAAVMASSPTTLKRLRETLGMDPADYLERQMQGRDMGEMKLLCARKDDGYLLLLFNIAPNHPQPERLDQFLQECCVPLDPSCCIGIGRCYTADHMADSLVDAMLALRAEGDRSIRYVEEVDMEPDRDFSLASEHTLARLAQSGDADAVQAFLRSLWTQEDGTVVLKESLQQALVLCARRIARQSGTEEAFESAMKENGLRLNDLPRGVEAAEAVCRVFGALAENLRASGSGQEDKHLRRLMEYLSQEYMHDELSLDTASAATGLSPSYIGAIFRRANTSFLKELTDLRVSRARELLKNTELTVREIGEQVGMANQNTFIRAFKKAEGVTPGQYRMAEKTMYE